MIEWLNILIGLSVAGCSVLFFSLLLTYQLKEKLSAKWYYLSMKLSLFFFLFPIFLISKFFLTIEKEINSIQHIGSYVVNQNENIILTLFIVWLVGMFVSILFNVYVYQRSIKRIKENLATTPIDNSVQFLLDKHLREMKLKSSIKIKFCTLNISPVLIGILKPTVILPIYDIPHDELDRILRHELIHYKKKDLWVKRAMLITTILHWYNPFVYLLQKQINKWCELSCDEDVVLNLPHVERKKYGETILNTIYRSKQYANSHIHSTFFISGKIDLKKRLTKILEAKYVSKPIFILSTVMLIIVGGIAVFSADLAHGNIDVLSNENILLEENFNTEKSFDDESKVTEDSDGIISIKRSDESKFSEEDWEEILRQVENNEIILEE